jgi:hypothetical protein
MEKVARFPLGHLSISSVSLIPLQAKQRFIGHHDMVGP